MVNNMKYFITVVLSVFLIFGCAGYQKNYSTYSNIQIEQIKAARDVQLSQIENWKAVEAEKAKMLSVLLGIRQNPYMKISSPVVSNRGFEPVSGNDEDWRLVNIIKTDGTPNIEMANGMQTFATYLILSEYLRSNRVPALRMPGIKISSVQAPVSPASQVAGILKETMPAVNFIGGTLAVGAAVKGIMKQAGATYNGSFNQSQSQSDSSNNSINDSYNSDSWEDSSNNAVTGSYNPDFSEHLNKTDNSQTDSSQHFNYEFTDMSVATETSNNMNYDYDYDYKYKYEDSSSIVQKMSVETITDVLEKEEEK